MSTHHADEKFEVDPDLEREIATALDDHSLMALMEQTDRRNAPSADEPHSPTHRRTGTIAAVHNQDVLVEFSAKEQGVCDLAQFKTEPQVGSQCEFIVVSHIRGEGLLRLALPGSAAKVDWDTVQQDMIVEAMVSGANSGGLELEVAGHRAFMPISQIDLARVEDAAQFVGQKLRAKVVELDKPRRRIVLSRRAVLEAEREENRTRLFEELQVGQEIEGTVSRVEKYGAFVEIATGVDGLLHVSDMAWSRVKSPSDFVQPGQVVKVRVLKVDAESQRISLGLKQVSGDPWHEVEAKYPVGSRIKGTVTRTAPYGAFVELEPGVEGLVHVSQLDRNRVTRVEDIAKVGQEIEVQVTEIDLEARRIGLSIRAMHEKADEVAAQASRAEAAAFVKTHDQAHAMESLMGKFGESGGLKGGIG